jgi:lipoprotein-anchoring transpeptidase ErfK/SrfK
MIRLTIVVFLSAWLPALAQQAPPLRSLPSAAPSREVLVRPTVLKALPLGVDDGSVVPTPPDAVIKPPVVPAEPVNPTAITSAAQADSPLDIKPSGEDAVRLQIFLDEANFGPGVIDGKPGRFTELAVQSWNEVHGHPPDDWVAVNTAARKAVPNPLAVALVPELAKDWVDPKLPTKYSQQAKTKRMSYRSVGEFMAERYHCDVPYLIELNGAKKIAALKLRDSVIVPNVTPFRIELLTGARHEADERLSQRHVVVNTRINQMRIFEAAPAALVVAEPGAAPLPRANRALIATFPITPGQPKFIKIGTWELRNMVELPWWRYDKQLLETGKRSTESLNIPSGPNSPVGVIWNGTSKPGVGMHGTATPETIGRARSAGCIRLANWDAVRLPELIRPGATVEIR